MGERDKSDVWYRIEPGWWMHDRLGGICRERDGMWHLYMRLAGDIEDSDSGAFGSLAEAKAAAVKP